MRLDEQVIVGNLKVKRVLYELINSEIIPGSDVDPDSFWQSLSEIVRDLGPKNSELLRKRDQIQKKIDDWHLARKGKQIDQNEYKAFLTEIGYLLPEGADFKITTENVAPEISEQAGPQLVVPVNNARYALNAANARWGSLYDALYGTDVLSEENGAEKGGNYNPKRGEKVIAYAWQFLDSAVPLKQGSYTNVKQFILDKGNNGMKLILTLQNGDKTELANPDQFIGYNLQQNEITSILLKNNGLHIEIQIDKDHFIGRTHPSHVKDVLLEAAITTIQDCEDSVTAVDAEDKTIVYRNLLGLIKGNLETTFQKDGNPLTRKLNPDRSYLKAEGGNLTLPGRSLMLIRNVGIHMYTDAVLTAEDQEIPEGFLDAMVTALIVMHDLKRNSSVSNSRTGSIYLVKPKQHGPEETAATVELFARVEKALGLARNTIKIGIMDEERRTTINLKECIRTASDRTIFINTGFLDRTGDEIHTMMEAGPVLPKPDIKNCPWMLAYEDWNVDVGIDCGLPGKAQIGKGMWAMPDEMKKMVDTKQAHPEAGANTAWVPSPVAATLHAMHYHKINVLERQAALTRRKRASLDDILTLPLMGERKLDSQQVQSELENNVQGILGYVARWIGQGIGCSKVPDIADIGLMEDRATLRISSQLVGNWLYHNIVSEQQVIDTFKKMALVVDRQNEKDANYRKMSANYDESIEFQAALELVFSARKSPNGYTEPVLHKRRRELKQKFNY